MSIKVAGLVGTLTADPELRFTSSGTAVAKFVVVTESRRKKGGEWTAEDTSFWRCTAWNDLGVNIAASLRRGQRIFVRGSLKEARWTDAQGNERKDVELVVDDCGPSLKFDQVKVSRLERASRRSTASDDPWAV